MELPMWMKWDEMRWDEMRWSIGCIKQLALGLWLYVCNFIWDQRRLRRCNTWAWEIGILTLSKLYCYTSHWANALDSNTIWIDRNRGGNSFKTCQKSKKPQKRVKATPAQLRAGLNLCKEWGWGCHAVPRCSNTRKRFLLWETHFLGRKCRACSARKACHQAHSS